MTNTIAKHRSRRIDVRVTDNQDALIREAAALAGETVTTFLLVAAEQRASEMLESRRHLVMSRRAFQEFSAALDNIGAPVAALRELFALPSIPEA
jgi:uncharacterized protein (DUF1778 family)